MIIFLPLGAIILYILSRIQLRGVVSRLYEKLKYFIFWNGTMLFVMEGYSVLSLQTISKLAHSTYDTSLLISENLFSIFVLTAIIAAPPSMTAYFVINHQKFRQKLFMRRFN